MEKQEKQTLFFVAKFIDGWEDCNLHTNLDAATTTFNEDVESEYYNEIYLVEVLPDNEIGFGSYGDIYGGDVIREWRAE